MNLKFFLICIYSFVMLLIGVFLMFFLKKYIFLLRKLWAFTIIKLLPIEIEERGILDVDADIMVLNHNSVLDAILLEYLHPKEISWVTKDMLSKLPVFGYVLKLPKLILIDPTKRSATKTLLGEVDKAHSEQRPVGIFPEGRHGKTGAIGHFQKGIKVVAEHLHLTVQPIVLSNTKNIFNVDTFTASSGKIRITYLETMDTSRDNWFADMETNIREVYASGSPAMAEEADNDNR